LTVTWKMKKIESGKAKTPATIIPKKKVRISFGELDMFLLREPDESFSPMVVPKRGNLLINFIRNIIISLYTKGTGNSDIKEQI